MHRKNVTGLLLIAALLLAGAVFATPARAQGPGQITLVDASPPPDVILPEAPEWIRLTFDRVLLPEHTQITLTDAAGKPVTLRDPVFSLENPYEVSARIPEMEPGIYTVTYIAASPGMSVVAYGTYSFSVQPPKPELELIAPVDGQAFEEGPITLEWRTRFVDPVADNYTIEILLDGDPYNETNALEFAIETLPPGVHEIVTYLADPGGNPVPETETVIYVAMAQPDPEAEGRELAAIAEPDEGLGLTPFGAAITAFSTLALLAVGIWLGRIGDQGGGRPD